MLSASAALILFCWSKVQCPHLAQPVPLDSLCMCVCVCVCVCVRARVCVCAHGSLTLFCSLLCDGLYAPTWKNST